MNSDPPDAATRPQRPSPRSTTNVNLALIHVVEQAHSLARILDAAAQVIADRLHVDSCLVFLVDKGGNLAQSASNDTTSSGGSITVDAEAESIVTQVTAERRIATRHGVTSSLLAAPMLLRDSLVGVTVLQRALGGDYSAEDIRTVATICAQLIGIIENARIIDALDRGERPATRFAPRVLSAASDGGERILRGVGASPGIAIGSAVFRGAYRLDLSTLDLPAGDPTLERERVQVAIDKTRNDISRVQRATGRAIDEEHALIFASHLLLLNDPMLLSRIDHGIHGGLCAPLAIDAALDEFETQLRLVPDAYIRERIEDVEDLRSRLLDHVLGSGTRLPLGGSIVLTSRIPPSLVIEMKTEGARALLTETGGSTSHGVLLARAMGIPMVTGISGILPSVRPGETLIVDGKKGIVIVRPSAETVTRYEEERQQVERTRTEYAKFRNVFAHTLDGVRLTLHANIGVASDLSVARDNGAEGVGLYRTEFPFIVRDAFPTQAEQVRIYSKAYEYFPTGPINFRILDLGGDKFVTAGNIAGARGAFHGYRSIRVLFDHPDVLRDQVQALAIAAAGRPLRILIPMVTSIEDLRRIKQMINDALSGIDDPSAQTTPAIGVMIEVPAAVELAGDIANEADFLSIGTNDLTQYTLVVDREDSRMATLSDPYHPAILRMISRVTAAAHAAGTPVGVCGELAARADMALALMALGIDSLSVVPTAIPELKQTLANARLAPMQRMIDGILKLSDSLSVAAALREAQFG